MNRRRWLWLLVATCGFGSGGAEARAHFLFIKVGPIAEGGRAAEVYFSEQAEAGDPHFVSKVAHTKLWAQTTPGEFTPLVVRQGTDRLRAALPGSGSVAVIGLCEYGVLSRPNQPPFLLRYYPKAVAGKPDALNGMSRCPQVPLEIVPRFAGDHVALVALRDGKPVPEAVFHAVDADLTETTVKAGADGNARWTPPASGRYSLYVRDPLKQSGTLDGKSYEEIREFATLAFSWPLDPQGADSEAVAQFEAALATRAVWDDFPGFSAQIAGTMDGRAFTGKVTVTDDGTVKVETDDAGARTWLDEQLGSLVMHRLADSGDGSKPVLRFADDDEDHPLGRLLTFVGGHFASSYRVKDGQITVVNRHVGKRNMTITVLDNDRNADNKYLPRSYVVQYWEAATGTLDRAETFQDRWTRVGKFDLPTAHTVTLASGNGFSVRSVTLSEHKLTWAK